MAGIIQLPLMTRAASLAPETLDEATRTVDVVWSTGARVRRLPFFGDPYDEELSLDPAHVRLDRLNDKAPVLRVHDLSSLDAVVGTVVPGSARLVRGQGIATLLLSERAEVAPLLSDIKAGVLRSVSVGYRVQRFEIQKIDGQPDLWRAVDWTPHEISLVPVGADPGAGFRALLETNSCHISRSERTIPMDPIQSETAPSCAPVAPVAQVPAGEAPAPVSVAQTEPAVQTRTLPASSLPVEINPQALADQVRAEERSRVTAIYGAQEKLGLARAVADDLVQRGISLDQARATLIDAAAAAAPRISTHFAVPLGGRDERQTRVEAVSTALLHRFMPAHFTMTEPAQEYRGMTLLELGREFLTADGVRVRGLTRDEIATRSLMTTSDFPAVLGNVVNRTLRQAYEATPRSFIQFCRQVRARDFKDMHRVQLGEAPSLDEVPEGGEYKRGALSEAKETYRIRTFGKTVAVTRQVVINDDLEAFTRLPALYGAAGANLENDVVWSVFTANPAMADGKALFHADHKNLAATGAVLSVDAIGKGRSDMARQTGVDGKTMINVRPSYLIVPAALELKADQLLAQNLYPAKSADIVPQSIRLLTLISEPRLDLASATAWYLAASPSQIDTIEYAYLESQQGMYIETRAGFDVDGIEIKCRLDFGAKAIDWRGLYKNAGV